MKIAIALALFLVSTILLCSCDTKEKRKPVYVDIETDDFYDDGFVADDDSVVTVPFKIVDGVKTVDVKINGSLCVEMIFDTGCSGTLISIKEAQYLVEKGLLTEDDFLGTAHSQIADGSIVENMVVNLKEVEIGGQILCTDVEATVSNSVEAPLLLGNEIFDRMSELTIDNENQVLKFK